MNWRDFRFANLIYFRSTKYVFPFEHFVVKNKSVFFTLAPTPPPPPPLHPQLYSIGYSATCQTNPSMPVVGDESQPKRLANTQAFCRNGQGCVDS